MKTLINELKKIDGVKICMEYIDSKLNVKKCINGKTVDRIFSFFKLYFDVKDNWQPDSIASLYFFKYSLFEKNIRERCNSRVLHKDIRVSSAKEFNLSIEQYLIDEYYVYDYIQNDTAILIDYKNLDILIFMGSSSEIAVVEFLRDIVIKDQENKGSIVLHAAAVEKNGRVIAIAGRKGAGKSTAMMELILNGGYHFFSGDKLIARVSNEEIIVKGWPDYPHIGVGTISRYKVLIDTFFEYDFNNMDSQEKIILDFEKFYGVEKLLPCNKILNLKTILFPQFDYRKKSLLVKEEEIADRIMSNIEYKEDFSMSQWHNIVPKSYDREKVICNFQNIISKNVYAYSWHGNFEASLIEDLIR